MIRTGPRLFADKYGVERVLGSYEDVLDDPEVDVVYNPLANSLHGPWNLAAVRGRQAGARPRSRSPATPTRRVEVAAAAEAAGVHGAGGRSTTCFHPVTCAALELVGDGDPRRPAPRRGRRWACPRPATTIPAGRLTLAGGALMDLGCYGLHVMRTVGKILGAAPEVVAARAVERNPGVDARCDVELGSVTSPPAANHSMVDDEYLVHHLGAGGPAEKRWCTTSSSRRRTTG